MDHRFRQEEVDEGFEAISRFVVSICLTVDERVSLTPGSEIEACKKEDIHRKQKYANIIGKAGEILCQRYGALERNVSKK